MKRVLALSLGVALSAVLGSGCGSNDPFSLLQQSPGDQFPQLAAPVPANGTFQVRPFGNGSDGFDFYTNSALTGQTPVVTSPGPGWIELVDTGLNPGFYALTIYHSPLLTSRVSGIQSTSVRVGDYVNQGDTLGVLVANYGGISAQPVHLSVYVNGSGTAVCPLSYLSSAARVAFQLSQFGGQYPCLQ